MSKLFSLFFRYLTGNKCEIGVDGTGRLFQELHQSLSSSHESLIFLIQAKKCLDLLSLHLYLSVCLGFRSRKSWLDSLMQTHCKIRAKKAKSEDCSALVEECVLECPLVKKILKLSGVEHGSLH